MLSKEQVKEVVDKYKLECWLELNSTDLTVNCLGNWEGFGFALWYETDTFEYRLTGSNVRSFNANSFLSFSDDYLEAMGVSTNWYHRWLPVIDELMELSGMKNEPTVPEQINAILKAHKVEQSDDEAEKTCITEDGFARIYASELVIVIQPEQEVMHISTLKPNKSYAYKFHMWGELKNFEFPIHSMDYIWWKETLKPALFEIIDVLNPQQDAGMDEDRIPDDSDGGLPPNPNGYSPENGEPTYDQLKKRVQKLEGRLSVIQKDNDDLLKACEQLRESNKKKSERIEELSEIADGYYKRLELYQWAFEDYLSTIRESRKGVTSDS